jgi:hypothetical protein
MRSTASPFISCNEFDALIVLLDKLKKKNEELFDSVETIKNKRLTGEIKTNQGATVDEKKHVVISTLRNDINQIITTFNNEPTPSTLDDQKLACLSVACQLFYTILDAAQTHIDILITPRNNKKLMAHGLLQFGAIFSAVLVASTVTFSWPAILLAGYAADKTCQAGAYVTGISNYTPMSAQMMIDILGALSTIIKKLEPYRKQAPDNRNYYEILELPFGSTIEEVALAYRKQSIKYHPDKLVGKELNNDDIAKFTTIFIALTDAYKALSDPETKARYDKAHGEVDNHSVPRLLLKST